MGAVGGATEKERTRLREDKDRWRGLGRSLRASASVRLLGGGGTCAGHFPGAVPAEVPGKQIGHVVQALESDPNRLPSPRPVEPSRKPRVHGQAHAICSLLLEVESAPSSTAPATAPTARRRETKCRNPASFHLPREWPTSGAVEEGDAGL